MVHRGTGNGRPGRRGRLMTCVACVSGIDMVSGFAAGNRTIMATDASANHLTMIDRGRLYRCPVRRKHCMAGLTHVRTINMTGIFATGANAVMATDTICRYIGVIHRRRYPLLRTVAGIAFLRGCNVRRPLTSSDYAIVATGTNTQNFIVIHC